MSRLIICHTAKTVSKWQSPVMFEMYVAKLWQSVVCSLAHVACYLASHARACVTQSWQRTRSVQTHLYINLNLLRFFLIEIELLGRQCRFRSWMVFMLRRRRCRRLVLISILFGVGIILFQLWTFHFYAKNVRGSSRNPAIIGNIMVLRLYYSALILVVGSCWT